MSRMWWIIILVAAGVGIAVVIGILGTRNEPSTSKTQEASSLCASLKTLESSLQALTGLSSSSSKAEYQTDVTAVQDDWNQVKSDAQAVQNAPTGDLDSAWDSFSSAVKDVPDDASVQDAVKDVTQSAEQLASAAQSTAAQVNCSSSSMTTTTTS
jgi:predicted Zn-dependent protease